MKKDSGNKLNILLSCATFDMIILSDIVICTVCIWLFFSGKSNQLKYNLTDTVH